MDSYLGRKSEKVFGMKFKKVYSEKASVAFVGAKKWKSRLPSLLQKFDQKVFIMQMKHQESSEL